MTEQTKQNEQRELTLGETLVGINFNPDQRKDVQEVKYLMAAIINRLMFVLYDENTSTAQSNIINTAINEVVGAQMWAVKALTMSPEVKLSKNDEEKRVPSEEENTHEPTDKE